MDILINEFVFMVSIVLHNSSNLVGSGVDLKKALINVKYRRDWYFRIVIILIMCTARNGYF